MSPDIFRDQVLNLISGWSYGNSTRVGRQGTSVAATMEGKTHEVDYSSTMNN